VSVKLREMAQENNKARVAHLADLERLRHYLIWAAGSSPSSIDDYVETLTVDRRKLHERSHGIG
jgi:hypothetical protein